MNLDAYHPSDTTRSLIHIDDWVTTYKPNVDGKCRVCHEAVYVKAAKTQKQTHFAHYQKSSCPTVKINHKPYDKLKDHPRDSALSVEAKAWLSANLISVYEKLKTFVKALSWKEFHALIDTANKVDIWSLKDMPHDYIPYVLLMCTEEFKKNTYGRKSNCFFVLETSQNSSSNTNWNDSNLQKKYIWKVNTPSREVTHILIELKTETPWFITKSHSLLG